MMAFEVKSEILSAIGKTDDPNLKMVLLLMLGVLEATDEAVKSIGDKIDALRDDEESLRKAVLNGYEPVHHKHHEWVAERIKANDCATTCTWVRTKIDDEAEAAKESKANRRVVTEAVIRQVVTIIVSGALGMLGAAAFLK